MLKPAIAMERGPPPLLPQRKPPRLPRRPAEGAAVGKTSRAQGDIPPRDIPAARSPQGDSTDACMDLAKLMLSPDGLGLKKITLEGFTVPVSLRLLDRRRPQQEDQQQQQQQQHTVSEATATAAAAALSITWIQQDSFGFDMRGLTIRRVEDGGGVSRAMAAGRMMNRGVGSGAREDAHVLVLSWGVEGGSAEVVLEAASRQQRDFLAVTLEMLVSGLDGGDRSAAAGASGDGAWGGDESGELPPPRDRDRDGAAVGSSAVLGPPPDVEAAAESAVAEFDEAVAVAASATADAGSRRTTLAPHETGATTAGHGHGDGDGGGLPSSRANFRDAAVTPPREVRRKPIEQHGRTTGGLLPRRRGVSFSPGRPAGTPVLARGWTTGAVAGRDGEAAQQQQQQQEAQEAQEARAWRQDAMVRLLAVYDRARDEAQAAAWRLGAMKLKRVLSGTVTRQMEGCWAKWCGAVRRANDERQKADRRLWFLHAKTNQNNDLLAWYHATFCREVYRRRVPFWFRETQLKPYQKAYRIVDDGDAMYTPMEKSLMTSCVCTVGTKYADVAAQLFTAKGVLSAEEYRVFQTLVKRGAEVPKGNPKSGKRFPNPMNLRLWFNRGAICLTAKRDKPDGAASKDHSFYLSKVKTCVIALPGSSRRGSKTYVSDGIPTPTGGGGSSHSGGDAAGFGEGLEGGVALAPSPADSNVSGGADGSAVGRRGPASSPSSAAAALSPPPPSPSAPHHLPDATSAASDRIAPELAHDEADRGAGGGVGRQADVAAAGAAGTAEGPSSPGPRHRVLSIHFFGRAMTLDLWFASEAETVEWQGMLTKLSWKEQGYLYRGPPGDDCGKEEEDTTAEGEEEKRGGESTFRGGRAVDSTSNGGSGGGCGGGGGSSSSSSRGENEAATVSPVVVGTPSPSSSSSSPSIVTSGWEHATHGGAPPQPPPPLQPPPPCVR